MSVSVVEMVGHERDAARSSPNSKKRKHTDDERAERKKKKQKHFEAEDTTEVLTGPETTQVSKKKKRRKEAPNEEALGPAPVEQGASADTELPDVEEDRKEPATEKTPAVPKKKKKRKVLAEDKAPSLAPATSEQEDIELPDADDETFVTPPAAINGSTSTPQPTLPSDSTENSPFHTTQASLYVPCPAISLSTALPSLISTHLMPLLLTYYGPLDGIVLSITSVSLSSRASNEPGKPLQLPSSPSNTSSNAQLALCADDAGVSFAWLTFTATTFHPNPSTTLSGYINVASEGFIGLVLYNYFQVGIARTRIPRGWKWNAPGSSPRTSKKQPKKGRIRDADSEESSQSFDAENAASGSTTAIPDSQATASQHDDTNDHSSSHLQNTAGHWSKPDGSVLRESEPLSFRVVDCDIVPSNTRNSDKMSLQIEGTLLEEDEEREILAEERTKFERAQNKAHGRTESPGSRNQVNMMSGGLGIPSREGSVAVSTQRHRVAY